MAMLVFLRKLSIRLSRLFRAWRFTLFVSVLSALLVIGSAAGRIAQAQPLVNSAEAATLNDKLDKFTRAVLFKIWKLQDGGDSFAPRRY
jgi:hypothetical protein